MLSERVSSVNTSALLHPDTDCTQSNAAFYTEQATLRRAINAGKSDTVKQLIEQSIQIEDARNPYSGESALHVALTFGHVAVVKVLLEKGARINEKEGLLEDTVLHLTARSGYEDFVKILLDSKATVNKQHNSGRTAIHFAVQEGHVTIVRMLLESGDDVYVKDCKGLTALHCAAIRGHNGIIEILLKKVQI